MVRWSFLLVPALLGACASTTAPVPPPEERLVVVNAGDNSLSLIPVDSTRPVRRIPLGPIDAAPSAIAARGETAVVAAAGADEVVVVDLVSDNIRRVIRLAPGSAPSAVTFVSDVIVYVANARAGTVTRIDITSGDTASVAVGTWPRALVLTRGRLFAVNANTGPCATGICSLGPSWLTVIDPGTNARAQGVDSIPLQAAGNARSATLGGDGLVYIVNIGTVDPAVPGRLSIIDPVRREEVGNFGGFGFVPQGLAGGGADRLFVTSTADGLMEFNTRSRRVVRGAGQGVLVTDNVAAAVDLQGRIYAVASSGCATGAAGRLRVFRPDLTEARNIALGPCPVAITFVQLPGLAAAD